MNKSRGFELTLLGTGTSQGVPVIACDCPVCQSEDQRDKRLRSSALITSGKTNIAIDIGPDFRQQALNAGIQSLSAILITHEHNDHVIGMDEVRPFNFITREPVHVYAEERVAEELRTRFAYIFTENPYPGAPSVHLHIIEPGQTLNIEGVPVEVLRIYHGELPILGFKVGDTAYCTDTKTLSPESTAALQGINNFVVNALHHRPHHSHLNLKDAIALSESINAGHAYLMHVSHHMGKYVEVAPHLPPGVDLAYDGMVIRGQFIV